MVVLVVLFCSAVIILVDHASPTIRVRCHLQRCLHLFLISDASVRLTMTIFALLLIPSRHLTRLRVPEIPLLTLHRSDCLAEVD